MFELKKKKYNKTSEQKFISCLVFPDNNNYVDIHSIGISYRNFGIYFLHVFCHIWKILYVLSEIYFSKDYLSKPFLKMQNRKQMLTKSLNFSRFSHLENGGDYICLTLIFLDGNRLKINVDKYFKVVETLEQEIQNSANILSSMTILSHYPQICRSRMLNEYDFNEDIYLVRYATPSQKLVAT